FHKRIRDRQADRVAETSRTADRENRASALEEFAKFWDRSRDRHVSKTIAILDRNALRIGLSKSAATTATTSDHASIARGNSTVDKDKHIELVVKTPRVQRLRIDNRKRDLVLLEEPAHPARRH